MMRTTLRSAALLAILLLSTLLSSACQEATAARASVAPADGPLAATRIAPDGDEEIPLDQVPQLVKDAARAAVPGFVIESAEKETEDGVVLYSLEGEAGGEEVEVEVSTAGKVLEIEHGDDDDDDNEDDD